MDKLLFTTKEAAAALAISETTVRALVRAGELETVRLGGIRRVSASSVRALAGVTDTE